MAWDLFDRDGEGGFQICGVDSDAQDLAPIVELPIGCEITVESASASPEVLGDTERDLEAVTASLKGRIVATRRTSSPAWRPIASSRSPQPSRAWASR